ncbi:MAG: hypothetical protein ACI4KN_05465 [Gemmiger sp.]
MKKNPNRRAAHGTALNRTAENSIIDLRTPPVTGGAPFEEKEKRADAEPPRCEPIPSRQKNAQAFLAGASPGVMQAYAPGAKASNEEGWVEDDETVTRLVKWRQEAIY